MNVQMYHQHEKISYINQKHNR